MEELRQKGVSVRGMVSDSSLFMPVGHVASATSSVDWSVLFPRPEFDYAAHVVRQL